MKAINFTVLMTWIFWIAMGCLGIAFGVYVVSIFLDLFKI